jgi:hypothetical protein
MCCRAPLPRAEVSTYGQRSGEAGRGLPLGPYRLRTAEATNRNLVAPSSAVNGLRVSVFQREPPPRLPRPLERG